MRGMLTKSSSCCHAICICCSISKLEFCLGLQRRLSLLSSQWQSQSLGWGSGSIMDWFHRESVARCPLGFWKTKKYLLKTIPQIKHDEAQEWSLGSSPVSGSRISCAYTGYWCCSLQCLVLPVPAQQLRWQLAHQTSFFLSLTAWSSCG